MNSEQKLPVLYAQNGMLRITKRNMLRSTKKQQPGEESSEEEEEVAGTVLYCTVLYCTVLYCRWRGPGWGCCASRGPGTARRRRRPCRRRWGPGTSGGSG